MDVLSKADLLPAVFDAAAALGDAWAEGEPPPDRARASAAASGGCAVGQGESRAPAHCAAGAEPGSITEGGAGVARGSATCQEAGASDSVGSFPLSAGSGSGDPAEQSEAGGEPTAEPGPPGNAGQGSRRARGFSWRAAGDMRGAAEVARALPAAARVSAVTGCGLEALQAAVLSMMAPTVPPEAQQQSQGADGGGAAAADLAGEAVGAGRLAEDADPPIKALQGTDAVLLSSAG